VPFAFETGSRINRLWPAKPCLRRRDARRYRRGRVSGALFFLNAETFRRTLDSAVRRAPEPVRAIILEASASWKSISVAPNIALTDSPAWEERREFYISARLDSTRVQSSFLRKIRHFHALGRRQGISTAFADAGGRILRLPDKWTTSPKSRPDAGFTTSRFLMQIS